MASKNFFFAASCSADDMFNAFLPTLKDGKGGERDKAINKLEADVKKMRKDKRAASFEKYKIIIRKKWGEMSKEEKQMTAIIFAESGHDIGANMEPGDEMLRIGYSIRYRMAYKGKNMPGTNGDLNLVVSHGKEYRGYKDKEYNQILDPKFPNKFPNDRDALRSAVAAIKAVLITYHAAKLPEKYKAFLSFNRSTTQSPYHICNTGSMPIEVGRTEFWEVDLNCLNKPYWKENPHHN